MALIGAYLLYKTVKCLRKLQTQESIENEKSVPENSSLENNLFVHRIMEKPLIINSNYSNKYRIKTKKVCSMTFTFLYLDSLEYSTPSVLEYIYFYHLHCHFLSIASRFNKSPRGLDFKSLRVIDVFH